MASVVLVNPPIFDKSASLLVPPLGLAYIASTLKNYDIEVKIIDAPSLGLGLEKTLNKIASYNPEILGITTTTPLADSAYLLAKKARRLVKWIIMGGAHPTALRKKIFQECPEIDFLFLGEAEENFPEFVLALIQKKQISSYPNGILTPDSSTEPVIVSDLNKLPLPSWDLLPMERYRHPLFPGKKLATIISSRGCPYQCIFCDKSVSGSRWRARSADNVLKEIEELYFQEKVQAIIFYDDLFTLDTERVIEVCKGIIKKDIKISWKCEGRVNIIDEEMLYWMKKAGCRIIAYGIESANQKSLDWLKKGVSIKQIKDAVANTKKAGIKVLGYFIFGIPVESYEEALESIQFAIDLGLDYVQFGSLSPFPGSPLYELAKNQGWYQEAKAPAPEEYGQRRPLLISDNWSYEKLESILKEAYKKFYFRPSYLLGKIFTIQGLWALMKSGFKLKKWVS